MFLIINKVMLLGTLLLVIFYSVSAIDLKLTGPNPDDSWKTGQNVQVTWSLGKNLNSSTGHKVTQVDFDLFKGTTDNLVDNISFGVPIDLKSCDWIVQNNLESGKDYFVRVSSPEDPDWEVLSPKFEVISNKTSTAASNPASPRSKPTKHWPMLSYIGLFTMIWLL